MVIVSPMAPLIISYYNREFVQMYFESNNLLDIHQYGFYTTPHPRNGATATQQTEAPIGC